MISFILVSFAIASRDFQSLLNAPNCTGSRPAMPTAAAVQNVYNVSSANCSIFSVIDTYTRKQFNSSNTPPTNHSAIPAASLTHSLVTNRYTDLHFPTSSLDLLLLDALVITSLQNTTYPASGSTTSFQGTMWGVNNVGIAAGTNTVAAMNVEWPKTTDMVNGSIANLGLLWRSKANEFGVVYTDCIVEAAAGLPQSPVTGTADYFCTTTGATATVLPRHHTGFNLTIYAAANLTTPGALKTVIMTYGPVVTTFTCNQTALEAYMTNPNTIPYFLANISTITTGTDSVTVLVYGWARVAKHQQTGSFTEVWRVKYLKTNPVAALGTSPLVMMEIGTGAAATNYDTTKPVGHVFLFTK
jgi:hypothetical protein